MVQHVTFAETSHKQPMVTLAPWPDPLAHPDPKHLLKKHQEEDEEDEHRLEVPRSEYGEDGRLVLELSAFVAMRRVDVETTRRFQLRQTSPKRKAMRSEGSSRRKKAALNGQVRRPLRPNRR